MGALLPQFTTVIPADEVYADWNYRGGFFGVEVPSPEITSEIAALYDYLTITLQGIAFNKVVLANQPSATYFAYLEEDSYALRKSKESNTAGLKINSAENETFDVYSIEGSLVKSGINAAEMSSLPAGLYIINGKKIVVK